jgi:hypothetical protein
MLSQQISDHYYLPQQKLFLPILTHATSMEVNMLPQIIIWYQSLPLSTAQNNRHDEPSHERSPVLGARPSCDREINQDKLYPMEATGIACNPRHPAYWVDRWIQNCPSHGDRGHRQKQGAESGLCNLVGTRPASFRLHRCWGLVLKCYKLRTRQHKMLKVKVLRPSKHYFSWDIIIFRRRS